MTTKKKFTPQRFSIAKGLTREKAIEVAKKRAKRDFRSVQYDPKTGELILI